MPTEVEELIRMVQKLSPEQQRQVRDAIGEPESIVVSSGPSELEHEFKLRLLKAGLLKEIKLPITDIENYRDRVPFEIEGKPLSETIIEERR